MLERLQTPIASTRLSLVVNVILFILKLVAGIAGRSQALVADALNSLLDIVANVIVWLGIRVAGRPADQDHPFGHGNADNLAAVFVALILFVTGAYIGLESIQAIFGNRTVKPAYLATAVALGTVIVKEILYRYTIKIGRKHKSSAVIANAYDHRSDVIVSLGTLTGIILAQAGYPVMDPIAGLWVAFFIFKQGTRIIRDNIQTLMVASPGIEYEAELKDFIGRQKGVVKVVWLRGKRVGSGFYIDVAIQTDGNITVYEGHNIASQIQMAVREQYLEVLGVVVHVEPDY
nr:cation transporter [candidate division Zixibacteria bacterium]